MREKNRILAVIMSLFMVLSLISLPVSAAELTALDGKLKIQGTAMEGSTLSAKFKDVKPEGLDEDSVSYAWYRKTADDEAAEQAGDTPELKELSQEKTYKVTSEDIGSKIVLEVTGSEDKGFTGTLEATTDTVTEKKADSENAQDAAEQDIKNDAEAKNEAVSQDQQEEAALAEIPEAAAEDETEQETPSETLEPVENNTEEDSTASGDSGEENTEAAGSAAVDGIPAATEDGTYGENNTEDTDSSENSPEEKSEDYYQASAIVDGGSSDVMDFGTVISGQEDNTEGQFVTVTNDGNSALNFTGISPKHFVVQDITSPLEPGESVQLWVSPRAGSEPGTYEDTITYVSEEGAEASFTAKVVIQPAEQNTETPSEDSKEDPSAEDPGDAGEGNTGLSSEQTALNFTDRQTQVLTIKNSGTDKVTVTASSANGYVTVTPQSAEIGGGESGEFQIAPADGLTKETEYADQVIVQSSDNPEDEFTADVSVKIGGSMLNPEQGQSELNFGSIVEKYEELPKEQSVEIQNTGSVDATGLTVTSENGTPKYFTAQLSADSAPAGQSVILTVKPTGTFTGGNTYSEAFNVTDASGESTTINAVIKVDTAVHSISVNKGAESLDFATAKEGYSDVETKQFIVTNDGNVTETLNQPSAKSFQIQPVDAKALTLEPGASVTFTVSPNAKLGVNTYKETVNVTCSSSTEATATVQLSFQVVKGTATLTKIRQPSEIKGLANGTKKDASALKLPSTVVIETTNGKMKASVTWNLKKSVYDPSSTEAQSFTVNGTVSLPEGVDNSNKVSLQTTVKVNVNAYSAKQAQADNNKITGIEYNGVYTTQSRISFTAVGAGMDNGSPRKGDTRYIPSSWTVIDGNVNGWKSAPYTASFGLANSGDYILKVTFTQQQYNGKAWSDTGKNDVKQVSFSITKAKVTAPGLDVTSAANQKRPVKTGDNTPIIPFVIILIVAAGAAGGVVYYRKKRK